MKQLWNKWMVLRAAHEKQAEQLERRAAMAKAQALAYLGLNDDRDVTFERVEHVVDATGTYCHVEFRHNDPERHCGGMRYECYVDAFTGEVLGFLGTPDSIYMVEPCAIPKGA